MKICQRCGFDHDRIREQIRDRQRPALPEIIGLCQTVDRLEAERGAHLEELADYGRTVKRLRDQTARQLNLIRDIADLGSYEALEGPARARHFLRQESTNEGPGVNSSTDRTRPTGRK